MTRVLVVGGLVPEGITFFVYALLAAVPALPRWGVWLPLCPPLALVAGLLGRPTGGSR